MSELAKQAAIKWADQMVRDNKIKSYEVNTLESGEIEVVAVFTEEYLEKQKT